MDFENLVNDSWVELECKPEAVEVLPCEWHTPIEEQIIQEIGVKEEKVVQQPKQKLGKQHKQLKVRKQPRVHKKSHDKKASVPLKTIKKVENSQNVKKKSNKDYHKNYMVGDEAVKICRICLEPEGNKKFWKLFDPTQNTANDLFYLSSVVTFEVTAEFPALICSTCKRKLTAAVQLKKMAIRADKYFRIRQRRKTDVRLIKECFESTEEPKPDVVKEEKTDDDEEWNIKVATPHDLVVKEIPKYFVMPNIKIKKEGKKIITVEEPKNYKCDHENCGRVFQNQKYLDYHKQVHTFNKFECPVCGKELANEAKLHNHVWHHKKAALKSYTCDYCGDRFPTKTIVLRHIATKHVKLPSHTFICQYCAKEFRMKGHLKIHVDRHEGNLNHQCEYCPARFITGAKLQRHMVTHDVKMYGCTVCDKNFTVKKQMHQHLKEAHNVEPPKSHHTADISFKCPHCEKSFRLHRHLRIHILKFHLEHPPPNEEKRRFQCEHCPQEYQFNYDLARHMITHKESKNYYDCKLCLEGFMLVKDLQAHMKTHHPGTSGVGFLRTVKK